MEDGVQDAGPSTATGLAPPPPPEPSADATAASIDPTFSERSDVPLHLENERWDITTISALGALRMLISALQILADAVGDVPPTPPVSRPVTPGTGKAEAWERTSGSTSSPEVSGSMTIGSPEAHPHERITVQHGVDAEDSRVQRIAIARRFFSKVAPPFSVSDYLLRLHHWCPHSPGVYLTAAVYCHRLCVGERMVPATNRTIHRLSLAAIRVAAKAVEDNKWSQDRVAKVGGVSRTQLMTLEVALCFLMDFELGVDPKVLAMRMFLLQQAGRHTRNGPGLDFKLMLPSRKKSRTFV